LDRIILKILVAKNSVKDGRVWGGGRNVSSWSKDVCDVWEGIGLSVWWWFDVNFSRKVSNGEQTTFLRDKWLGDELLNIKFCRLFELSFDKNISVANMYTKKGIGCGGDGKKRWRWCLFVWEDELHMECCAALGFIFL
jgi:hypothetical protein